MALNALGELSIALRTKSEREKITKEEYDALKSVVYQVVDGAFICSCFVGGFVWKAARRLKGYDRPAVAAASASLAFIAHMQWAGRKTIISFFDHILGQDATRMQKELLNILSNLDSSNPGYGTIRDIEGDSWRLKVLTKHFYPESVYNDDTADKPQTRWRRRNIFTDAIFSSNDIDKSKLDGSYGVSPATPNRIIHRHAYVTRSKPKVQYSTENPDGSMGEDPLACIFSGSETSENVQSPVNSAELSRALTRKQKRAQRRRKIRNQEASLGTPQHEHT